MGEAEDAKVGIAVSAVPRAPSPPRPMRATPEMPNVVLEEPILDSTNTPVRLVTHGNLFS